MTDSYVNNTSSWNNNLQFTQTASFDHQNILCGEFLSHFTDEGTEALRGSMTSQR